MEKSNVMELFGAKYIEPNESYVFTANEKDLYYYKVFIGEHKVNIEKGDCAFYLDRSMDNAILKKGEALIVSKHIAIIIRGYMPCDKTSSIKVDTCLPYVNGCSTKQIFPPERAGDPTLQMLKMPPYSSEQAHHIHSTVRVVYVLSGKGHSIVGMNKMEVQEELYPGKVVILNPMCPHHFETDEEVLIVLPLHVFSSIGGLEFNHPMFNGTHMMD